MTTPLAQNPSELDQDSLCGIDKVQGTSRNHGNPQIPPAMKTQQIQLTNLMANQKTTQKHWNAQMPHPGKGPLKKK